MRISTKGLVIREQTTGESDRLVTLLTADYGLVRAFVRRAKQMKSRMNSATSLFAYGDFSLYRSKDAFVVDDAVATEVFFGLRKDIERLSLAQYFAQLAFELGAEEQPCEELLRLTLNSLHLLCKGEKSLMQIKAVFELRAMCLGGYMPGILACDNCGTYETPLMYFDTLEGKIYCENCPKTGAIPLPKTVITAVRFICLTEPSKIFSFSLSDENMKLLSDVAEKYMLSRVQRKLSALEFYKGLTG
ncbi:MAG: DNA repair protein RecO [Eubacterium sp.]|uniref:DNA repair protein RecO n=1 Tax=Eubacterium sp. TaxID=142586 RepID=UPI003A39EB80